MPVSLIPTHPKQPIKLLYIPEFIYQITQGIALATDLEKLQQAMNTSDLFHYRRLNQILNSMITLENEQLFDGFDPFFEDHPFFTEREEEFQQWKKQVEIEANKYDREDHPTLFNFKDLGNINLIEYDKNKRILYLVNLPANEYQPFAPEDYPRYQEFLKRILKAIGKYNRYDDVACLPVFKETLTIGQDTFFETLIGNLD